MKLYSAKIFSRFESVIKKFSSEELLVVSEGFLSLTEKGFLFSDYISLRFAEKI